MPSLKKISITLSVAALTACASSPTGRSQIILFSDVQMSQLGAQSFEEMKAEIPKTKNQNKINYVQCITDALLPHVPIQGGFSEWEVVVFDSEQVNAFALPGGKIGVYTGIMEVAETADQLAAVIGHEIVHVTAQHGNERMSQAQLANIGMQVTSVALHDNDYRDLAMGALGLGVQVGVLLPYGRTQESEADIVGLEILAKAGFDPNASVTLWQNMAKASGGNQPPELLSTHPSHSTRISDLQAKIKQLPPSTNQAPDCERLL
ncbi:M48 family metallopeptidase [Vibrio ulleungensis]|jgi:predicted Zn-dependent protease|uniref:M48 family metallopeptidase n=1 Tax=Vibrio ulleungensis TaxID=2807619 RepID=A0ABS2HHG8_9VIBR|nr:M48 family metallopeptidase [Vibrio ulleungensis]MBM7036988.1 M48 family metallopeptidase [Vibrio ulleungensis]